MTNAIKLAIEALEEAAKGYNAMGWGSQRIDAALVALRAQPDHSELIAKLRSDVQTPDCDCERCELLREAADKLEGL